MSVALYYVSVALTALIVTLLFVKTSIGANTKGLLIMLSVAALAFMCMTVFSSGWWHCLGLVATYVVVLRVTAMICTAIGKK